MKKIFVLCVAAIVALGAFSCQKDDVAGIQTPEFNKEGLQKYTFTVSGVETKMTYVTDKTNHKITPKWAVGDTIYVYGSDDAYFEVTDVADNGSATVVGYSQPGSGNLTLIYSPCITSGNQSNFNLIDQKGHLDKDFPAIYYGSVDLGATPPAASFKLKTFILEISNVKGISNGSVINSIIVEGTNIAAGSFGASSIESFSGNSVKADLTSWTDSKNVVGEGGTLPESVFISLAPGSISKITVKTNNNNDYIWQPSPAVTLNAETYRYVSTKTFTPVYPGTNISAVKVGNLWWAPVNCGYDQSHPNGLLYQWGRKYGQNYDEERSSSYRIEGPLSRESDSSYQNCFIKGDSDDKYWYNGPSANDKWEGNYNPCPEGWRVPKSTELSSLGNGTWDSNARKFADGKLIFPAAGYTANSGNSDDINEYGYYWSSTTDGNQYAIYMVFDYSDLHVYNNQYNGYRSRGMSVRCVKDVN